jgi:hypothetical protein
MYISQVPLDKRRDSSLVGLLGDASLQGIQGRGKGWKNAR